MSQQPAVFKGLGKCKSWYYMNQVYKLILYESSVKADTI